MTADHSVRPIIVPRDVSALPWNAGYAETINAGKSRHNEDQAMARQGSLGVLVGGKLHQIHYTGESSVLLLSLISCVLLSYFVVQESYETYEVETSLTL